MDNIFENAYFGKAYKTRDGSKAIFICERTNCAVWDLDRPYACVIEGYGEIWNYFPNGRLYFVEKFETENDIISEWEEPINEDELDKLANKKMLEEIKIAKQSESLGQCYGVDFVSGFKVGYRAAKKGE